MATLTLDPRQYVESRSTYDPPTSYEDNYVTFLSEGGAVPISVQPTRNGFLAVDSLVSMWGAGHSPEDAISDLLEALEEHLQDLRSHVDRLTPHLERQLRRLEYVFRKNAHS